MTFRFSELSGLRFLNTRTAHQSHALKKIILTGGGQSIDLPVIAIEPLHGWLSPAFCLSNFQQAIFISPNAVHCFFKAREYAALDFPETLEVIAIGHATGAALQEYGIAYTLPSIADSEHVLMLPELQSIQNQSILLVKGEQGRMLLEATLQARGAVIQAIAVYRRSLPKYDPNLISSLWQENGVDYILIFSETALDHLFLMFGKEGHAWLCKTPHIVISPRLVAAAKSRGIETVILSQYDEWFDT